MKRYMCDIRKEKSLFIVDIIVFVEICLNFNDNLLDYELDGYVLFWNDDICC